MTPRGAMLSFPYKYPSRVSFSPLFIRFRLSRDQKGKAVARATESSHARVVESNSPSDFETIHREAMIDTENMDTPQRVLVAESTRQLREERENATLITRDGQGGASEGETSLPDFVPCCYHPGGIFEDLPALAPELMCSPIVEGQTWGNVVETRSSPSSVKVMLRECGGVGVTFLIPTKSPRPWSPPLGFQCVYESYFQNKTKLWFTIPRLVTSYARRRDAAMSQFLNGAFRILVALMVAAEEINVSMSVQTLEELTYVKSMGDGLYSIQMRPNYNVIVDHPSRTNNWQHFYFYVNLSTVSFFHFLTSPRLVAVDHPDSASYPEEFIANARAVASLAQVSWKDITVERIRRAVDRISKKQKVINAAREMKELPDLSALIKKKLSGAKKTSFATPSETTPGEMTPSGPPPLAISPGPSVDPVNIEYSREDLVQSCERETAEPSVTDGNKKKRSAPESSASVDARARTGSDKPPKKKKKKEKKKRKKFIEGQSEPIGDAEGHKPVVHEGSSRDAATRAVIESSGGAKDMPPVKDLIFKDAYVDAARTKVLSDGSMNYVVELYDTTLKETISKLKQSDRLVRAKDTALNRKTSEFRAAIDKAAAEQSRLLAEKKAQKEKFMEKFGELKDKFKTAGEKIRRFEREKAALEKEKTALKKEKTALEAVAALKGSGRSIGVRP
ncbi:PREDICTED: uncharacterized protein At3g60930, chloroplastic-like [Brassica oleracea var. oleracea]|uniref:uncharacterized protein At3g60930, chloroplastic-like n=1 Tax=Brassica oleracea var. oleracea TaxID=109376 RepID=UPI0006A70085|nr:PREDICTED: uncharacterized protein At3g60930, chloroplastic-like [Brassica oleracea var. oleracea]